jgi:Retroviral aspartyl protease
MGGRTPILPAFTMRDLIDYVNNVAKTDIKKVKVQDDQVTHTIEMAMCTDSSPKVLLPHIHLYLSLIQGYEFSTVLKEHELFGKSLGGHVRASWNRLVSDIDQNEERDIMDTIRELISEACIGQYDIRERQTFYNRHLVAKSEYREVAIPAFLGNLRSINALADLLPGDSPIMDENAIKASFLNSMPKAWKDEYENNVDTNVTDDAVAIQPIVSKMVKLEKASAEKAELNKKRNATNGNGNHTTYKKGRTGYSKPTDSGKGGKSMANGSGNVKKNEYQKRKDRRNDPNYKGCSKHTPAGGPQALHTDDECFDNPKNADKKKAWLEKKAKNNKTAKSEVSFCEIIAQTAEAKVPEVSDDADDDIMIVEVHDVTTAAEPESVPKLLLRGGLKGQRSQPELDACPKVLTLDELTQKRPDIFQWAEEELMEQGADTLEAKTVVSKIVTVNQAIRRILSGWCFQWAVPPHIKVEYPHIFKKIDGTTISECNVATTQYDANTASHHFDNLIAHYQTNEDERSPLDSDIRQRLEPLIETLFVDGDDHWSIFPRSEDSSVSVNEIYSSEIMKESRLTIDPLYAPMTIVVIHTMGGISFNRPLRALCDSGSDITLIQQRCVPQDIPVITAKRSLRGVNGQCQATKEIQVKGMLLPELSPSKKNRFGNDSGNSGYVATI